MLKRLFPPPPEPELANEPLQKVDALGGPLGDIKHSAEDLARATALATGEHAAMFSHLDVRHSSCFGPRWTKMWAIVMNGTFRVYRNQASVAPHRVYEVKDCDCHVGEREACRTDYYCFKLQHAEGVASFCAGSSKELLLWLQALQAGGIKYEDPPLDLKGISSLFSLSANLLSGEPVELSQYAGCVCLVVNAASK